MKIIIEIKQVGEPSRECEWEPWWTLSFNGQVVKLVRAESERAAVAAFVKGVAPDDLRETWVGAIYGEMDG